MIGIRRLSDRLLAVRETGVSWHQGGPIEGPPETPRTSQQGNERKRNYSFLSVLFFRPRHGHPISRNGQTKDTLLNPSIR